MSSKTLGDKYQAEVLTIAEAQEKCVQAFVSGMPRVVYLIGPPGIGKTQMAKEVSEIGHRVFTKPVMNSKLVRPWSALTPEVTVRPGQTGTVIFEVPYCTPATFRGYLIPNVNEGTLRSCKYNILPEYKEGAEQQFTVILFDELLRGNEAGEVTNVLMSLMEEGKSHNLQLAENTLIIAATNPDDGSDSDIRTMSDALRRRGFVFVVLPDLESFVKYGTGKNKGSLYPRIHPMVLTFVQREGLQYLYNFEGESSGQVHICPAGVEKISDLYILSELGRRAVGGSVPKLKEVVATIKEKHGHPGQIHRWLTALKDDNKLYEGWALEDLKAFMSGMGGPLWASKFINFVHSSEKVLLPDDILLNLTNVEDKVKRLAKDFPDHLSQIGEQTTETLWTMGLKHKRINKAILNYSKFLEYLPEDSQVSRCQQIIKHLEEIGPANTWSTDPVAKGWLLAFRKYPSLRERFIKMAQQDRELNDSRSKKEDS